jgi:hypothetical protein
MSNPWDRPPFPTRGNSERVLFEAVGRALMAWEEVEGAFAHLYSTFLTGWPFDLRANRKYGEPLNFVHRVEGLKKAGCRFFRRGPSQDREGEFDEVIRQALGWSARRNDVAHGRARYVHWVLDPSSRDTLLSASVSRKWCVIPAHFRADKFVDEDTPAYVFTSRELRRFADSFWDLARQANSLMHKIESPSDASYGRLLPPLP